MIQLTKSYNNTQSNNNFYEKVKMLNDFWPRSKFTIIHIHSMMTTKKY